MIKVIHPAYIEFLIGEIGIIDSKYAPKKATVELGGEIVYSHVNGVANNALIS